jgi:antirestriction protein ArdC
LTTTTRPDFYARITDDIVSQLERGARPWHQPWNAQHAAGGVSRPLRNNGQPYQGVNVLVLWLTAFQKGYACPIWLTFNQAKEAGGFVKKGEHGATVVYANSFEKKDTDAETGNSTLCFPRGGYRRVLRQRRLRRGQAAQRDFSSAGQGRNSGPEGRRSARR